LQSSKHSLMRIFQKNHGNGTKKNFASFVPPLIWMAKEISHSVLLHSAPIQLTVSMELLQLFCLQHYWPWILFMVLQLPHFSLNKQLLRSESGVAPLCMGLQKTFTNTMSLEKFSERTSVWMGMHVAKCSSTGNSCWLILGCPQEQLIIPDSRSCLLQFLTASVFSGKSSPSSEENIFATNRVTISVEQRLRKKSTTSKLTATHIFGLFTLFEEFTQCLSMTFMFRVIFLELLFSF